jgi:hypothetical protein
MVDCSVRWAEPFTQTVGHRIGQGEISKMLFGEAWPCTRVWDLQVEALSRTHFNWTASGTQLTTNRGARIGSAF